MSKPPTPRQLRRVETVSRILDSASDRLRDGGPDALTIRGIAADLDMSPAALYRYFDGRDAIVTELITRAYQSLGEALADPQLTEPSASTEQSLLTPAHAYRRWALGHRHEFDLLFGEPIPGYTAPSDGPTTHAMEMVQMALLRPAFEATAAGTLTIPESFDTSDEGQVRLQQIIGEVAGHTPTPGFGLWATTWWATIHGLVALELNGQFEWLYGDDAEPQFGAALRGCLGGLR